MGWFRRLRSTIFDGDGQDFDEEAAFHLAARTDEFIRQGLTPEDAARAARRRLGNLTQAREGARDVDTIRWLNDFSHDLRYAVRLLRRSPGFAVAAIVTLGLGIGANTAIFAVFDAVLLRSLPVRDPARLVLFATITGEGTQTGNPPTGAWHLFSTAVYEYLSDQPLPYEGLAAVRSGEDVVSVHLPGVDDGGQVLRAQAHLVSGNYFSVMGVDAAIGRTLRPTDEHPAASPATVVSDGFWRDRLHADPSVIGHVVLLNGTGFTIVGIAPPDFFGERVRRAPDFWMPLAFQSQIERRPSYLTQPDTYWLSLIGRLRPGASRAEAQTATTLALRQVLTGTGSALTEQRRREVRDSHVELVDGAGGISLLRQRYEASLRVLLAVVGLVLLLACANVASLVLSRSAARQTEISLRTALGASRMRLIRQFLTESLVLAGCGAVLGVVLARWTVDGVLTFVAGRGAPVHATLTASVLFFTIGITSLSALVFGLAPAWSAGRQDLASSLKAGRVGGSRRRRIALSPLIIGQLAVSFVLLVGANLFIQTLRNLEQEPLGLTRDHVLMVRFFPRLAGYQVTNVGALYRALYERLNALPGVERATVARYGPFDGTSSHIAGAVEGYVPKSGEAVLLEEVIVGPAYPETLGMTLSLGRAIGPEDTADRPKVGMVNDAFVRTYFPQTNPLGRHFGLSGSKGRSGPTDIEIVGVVADAQFHDARAAIEPIVFTALAQNTTEFALDGELLVRAAAGAGPSANEIRQTILSTDRNLPMADPRTLEEEVSTALNSDRLAGRLVTCFSGLALLLACVGLYGIVAQAVAGRSREIGVRMALGASAAHVVRLFLRHIVMMLVLGLGLGLPLAIAGGRIVASQLYGLRPLDPRSFGLAVVLLSAVALVTGLLPAHRATRVDPLVVLRAE